MTQRRMKVNLETGDGLIIERENLLTKFQQVGKFSWSIACWVIWMLLIRPLIVTMLWYLGLRTAEFQMIALEGIKNIEFFTYYSCAIIAIFFILLGWNRYNVYRFRGKDRRNPRGACSSDDLAKYYNIEIADVAALQNSNVDIYFSGDESIILETDSGKKIKALYAPQNLQKHFSNMHDKGDLQ